MPQIFQVEIKETLDRVVQIEAETMEEALKLVESAWCDQEYVLDSGDFVEVDFSIYDEPIDEEV